ncbi:MAG: c-type cytochrome domain-containing protein [Pseudobdellovibrionaceae bacterium]
MKLYFFKKRVFLLATAAVMTVFFQNCSSPKRSGGSSNAPTVNVLEDKAIAILNKRCVSCHNAESSSANIGSLSDLESMLYYRLVVPGEPQLSDLYTVIQKGTMPPTGSLTADEAIIIYDWINEGINPEENIGVPPTPCGPNDNRLSCLRGSIFGPRCATCHMNGNSQGGVSLDSYTAVMNLVIAGNSAGSALYQAVNSNSMPPNGPLAAQEKALIKSWIDSGAPNN